MDPEINRAESRRAVFKETRIIAIGEVIGVILMLIVVAALGYFDKATLLGGIAGGVLAIANFFFMAVGATQAMDKAAGQDVKGGQKQIRFSYATRMAVIFVILFALVKSGVCNALTSVLPLAFVRPTITIAEFFRK